MEDEAYFELEHNEISNEAMEELRTRSKFISRQMVDGELVEFWITPNGQLLVCPAGDRGNKPSLKEWAVALVVLSAGGLLVWEGARWLGWL